MNDYNEKISVIVPVYNVEKYLERCIESILNQTYKNIEIIIVDDGSVDNSSYICEKYKKVDNRVKVFHKNNEGVSSARNLGLKQSTGKYILFVDSDDYLDINMIQKLYYNITKHNVDISICEYYLVEENKSIVQKKNSIFNQILNKEQFYDFILKDNAFGGYLFNKLIKRELFYNHNNMLLFNENIHICEDLTFLCEICQNINKVYYTTETLYYYVQRSDSALSSIYSKKQLSNFYAFKEVMSIYKKNNIPIDKNYEFKFLKFCFDALFLFRYLKVDNKTLKKSIKKSKKEYYKKLKKECIFDCKTNIKMFLSYHLTYIVGIINKVRRERKIKKLNKIAILTINDNSNYGNRLQNYAVQECLKKFNNLVETISNIKGRYGKKIIIYKIKDIVKKLPFINKKYTRYNNFMKFNKYINYSKYHIDENHIPNDLGKKYECFFSGSDQVWNPNFNRMSDIDFLVFAPKNKRNSFSASFGIDKIPDRLKEYYKNNLLQMNKISVREDRGKEIIRELTGRNDIEVLIDPTMLLDAEEWDKVSIKPEQIKEGEKYILNYFLGELSESRKNEIEKIAKENSCKIINIMDKNDSFYVSGPSEFLYLEKNAFLICTDSFHSSVFAILYNRPFIVFDREQEGLQSMNSRIDTLIDKFNLKNRRFTGSITNENLEHDYTEAYKILEKEREKSLKFLREALDIEG